MSHMSHRKPLKASTAPLVREVVTETITGEYTRPFVHNVHCGLRQPLVIENAIENSKS